MDFARARQLINKNDVNALKPLQEPQCLLHLRHKKSGDTLLHVCCRCGLDNVLSYFLEDLEANLEVSNCDGRRPLHDAAQYSQVGCLRILLNHGAETNVLKRSDWTPLMLACTKPLVSAIDLLLGAGADPCLKNKDGWNSFHIASRDGTTDILSRLVVANPTVWATTSNNLRTPLHTAALHGQSAAVSWMLSECNFHPDCTDSCGVTPFMDAFRGGHLDIGKALLDTGKVVVGREDKAGRQAVHHAAQAGQRSAIQFLVKELGVELNAQSSTERETPLHAATKDGQTETVLLLLDLGADATAVDKHGRTALDVARMCCQDACVAVLLQFAAKEKPCIPC